MVTNKKPAFPFTAIVGQEDFKLALMLTVVDPSIGGVLAVGDRGAGKTTLIRSLTQLMAGEEKPFPFINLPIGATEDRVLGHLHLEKLINSKKEEIQPGLMAKAHGGILYIDEINLLNDYLMDLLLDASASGSYYLEREGISRQFDSRFILIGSMNPEEGDLRPQLKDRFGLSVKVKTAQDKETRLKIIQNRMAFDDDPESFSKAHQEKVNALKKQLISAQNTLSTVTVSKANLEQSVAIALQYQVEGMRADVLLIKAAKALAAYQGTSTISGEQIEKVAPLVLEHRSHITQAPTPNNHSPHPPKEKEPQEKSEREQKENNHEYTFAPIHPASSVNIQTNGNKDSRRGIKQPVPSAEDHRQIDGQKKTDIPKTVSQYLVTDKLAIQKKRTQGKPAVKLVFMIDSSGSMVKDKAIAFAKGLIEKTTQQQLRQQPDLALIAISHAEANIVQPFTKQEKVLLEKLEKLGTGGKTNIIAGFKKLDELLTSENRKESQLILITDGRFNSGADHNVFEESLRVAKSQVKSLASVTLVDCESGVVRLGLAETFANRLGAHYHPLNVSKNAEAKEV